MHEEHRANPENTRRKNKEKTKKKTNSQISDPLTQPQHKPVKKKKKKSLPGPIFPLKVHPSAPFPNKRKSEPIV